MADNAPTTWSLAKNPPISNKGTIVDKRLTTITPDNPTGYIKLSTTSEDPVLQRMEYAIGNNGRVTYRYTTATGVQIQYNNIQEMVTFGPNLINNWNPTSTTPRFKDSLQANLTQRTQQIILGTSASPVGQTPQGDQQGGNAKTPPDAPELPSPGESASSIPINLEPQKIALEAQQLKIVPEAKGIRYPLSMTDDQDKIKFTAVEIQPRKPTDDPTLGFNFGKPEYRKVDGSIFLPIQAPISDQNSVEWGSDTVNAIDASLFKLSYKAIGSNVGQITNDLEAVKGNVYATTSEQQERIKRALAGQAASINNVLARTDNVVLNPNLELLFQGPQLRPFTFQFKMSAREPNEAEYIKRIIKYFKYHMAVRREASQLFLRAPHVFTIQYKKGDTINHPGINPISPTDDTKACALTNFSVDYTPLGSYATYEDGTMVSYTMNMQFQEITPIYDTDYVDNPHPIGF